MLGYNEVVIVTSEKVEVSKEGPIVSANILERHGDCVDIDVVTRMVLKRGYDTKKVNEFTSLLLDAPVVLPASK